MSKRIYAVADEVPESASTLFTAGTLYPVEKEYSDVAFTISDNKGEIHGLSWKASRTLGGGNWRRVEVDEGENDPEREPLRIDPEPMDRFLDAVDEINSIRDTIPARYLHPTKLQAPLSTLDAVRRMVEELEREREDETLRDEFAKVALTGLLAHPQMMQFFGGPTDFAAASYEHADAMLEARRKR